MTYFIHLAVMLAIYATLALSLDLVVSQLGILLLCHSAFYAAGAYATGIMLTKAGVPTATAILASGVLAGVLSVPLAIGARRLRHDAMVLASLAVLMIIVELLRNLRGLTGGLDGISGIPRPGVGPWLLDSPAGLLVPLGLLSAAAWLLTSRVISSPLGRGLRAYRDDYVSAMSLGISPLRIIPAAFVPAAVLAGLAGSFYATYVAYIAPSVFGLEQSVLLLAMVLVGGAGAKGGPLLGALLLMAIPETLRLTGFSSPTVGALQQLLFGTCLLCFVLLWPRGLLGGYRFR